VLEQRKRENRSITLCATTGLLVPVRKKRGLIQIFFLAGEFVPRRSLFRQRREAEKEIISVFDSLLFFFSMKLENFPSFSDRASNQKKKFWRNQI
jgi:hypothetical protein